jgi:hypothetical protein
MVRRFQKGLGKRANSKAGIEEQHSSPRPPRMRAHSYRSVYANPPSLDESVFFLRVNPHLRAESPTAQRLGLFGGG